MIQLAKVVCKLDEFNNCPGKRSFTGDVEFNFVNVISFDDDNRSVQYVEKEDEDEIRGPEYSWQNRDDTAVVLIDFKAIEPEVIADIISHFHSMHPDELYYYECDEGFIFRLWWD